MIDKYKGVYRLKVEYDLDTFQFPRKLDGTYENIDVYIDCRFGNKVFHYGQNILQAYIPSIMRGHNVIKAIKKDYGDILFDIEETDEEVLFKFKGKDGDKVIPLLKPKTNGASISPFSSKNLPVDKDYKIPDTQLALYKEIIQDIPKEKLLSLSYLTNWYLQKLETKQYNWDMIRADMRAKGLKGKEYIHSIGRWDDYINYLHKEVEKIINEESGNV